MYYALAQLICDGAGLFGSECGAHYPAEGAVQCAIISRMDLRLAARNVGWRRSGGKDLCPACAAKNRASEKGGR